MGEKIRLSIENLFNRDVLLPFRQRSRGVRTGVSHSDLSRRMFNALASYGMKELLIAGGGAYLKTAAVTAGYLIVEEYGISSINQTIDITISGKNGLDSGTEVANKWYSIWIIYDEKTQEVAGLFSTSESAPTLPVGFTKKRRVGWIRNNNAADFVRFDQRNNKIFYHNMQTTSASTATTWTDVNCSTFVPKTTGQALAVMNLNKGTATTAEIMIRPNGSEGDGWSVGALGADSFPTKILRRQITLPMDSSQIFEYWLDQIGNTTLIEIFGYEDQF